MNVLLLSALVFGSFFCVELLAERTLVPGSRVDFIEIEKDKTTHYAVCVARFKKADGSEEIAAGKATLDRKCPELDAFQNVSDLYTYASVLDGNDQEIVMIDSLKWGIDASPMAIHKHIGKDSAGKDIFDHFCKVTIRPLKTPEQAKLKLPKPEEKYCKKTGTVEESYTDDKGVVQKFERAKCPAIRKCLEKDMQISPKVPRSIGDKAYVHAELEAEHD